MRVQQHGRPIISSHSNFVRFVATLAAGMILAANDVYARPGGGGGSEGHGPDTNFVVANGTKGVGPGGNSSGTPGTCNGPACNARPPKGVSTTCGIAKLTGGFGVLYDRKCF
jgi:hypothetical protein